MASVLSRVELHLLNRDAARFRSSSPHVDQLLKMVCVALEPCLDFHGEIRDYFEQLLVLTLRFLRSRQDAQASRFIDRRVGYLFAWKEGGSPPLERQLADDYHEWLEGSDLNQVVVNEVPNIAGGRIDVSVSLGAYRFVAEIKREFHDASPEGLRHYLTQAGLYQGTNVTLGLLIALDLTDKSAGVPHFLSNAWVETTKASRDDLPRYVVVIRVPGNRPAPSDLSRKPRGRHRT